MVGALVGRRRIHKLEFPLHREIASFWNKCRVVSAGGKPSRCPCSRPKLEMVCIAVLLHPPRVSTTMGIKVTPTDRHESEWAAVFLSSPTCRACPGLVAAAESVSCCSGDITWTSRAAGRPLFQLGRKMSAGRLQELGIREETSFLGARAADWAAENRASRMESCR